MRRRTKRYTRVPEQTIVRDGEVGIMTKQEIVLEITGGLVFLEECSVMVQVIAVKIFFFNDTTTTEIYTLSLHDALPI